MLVVAEEAPKPPPIQTSFEFHFLLLFVAYTDSIQDRADLVK